MNKAAMRVRNGTSIVIFPEGTRSPDGVLQDFKKGGFMLAIKSRQPVVPISISGSYSILPKKGDWLISPGRIDLTIGMPIATSKYSTKDRDRLIQTVREAIRQHLTGREGGVLPDHVYGSSEQET
jgi:1-acyl-sn-glycerol-3-phosphate acyltransferase